MGGGEAQVADVSPWVQLGWPELLQANSWDVAKRWMMLGLGLQTAVLA